MSIIKLSKVCILACLVALLNGCENHKTFNAPAFPLMSVLVAPVNLDSSLTCIRVSDFVSNLPLIDTIIADASLTVSFSKDKKDIYVKIIDAAKVLPVSTLKIFSHGFCYAIVLKKTNRVNPLKKDSVLVDETFNIEPKKRLHISANHYNFSEIIINANAAVNNIVAVWQNQLLPTNFVTKNENKFVVRIPEVAEKLGISFIRIWASNSEAASNDLIVPLKDGHVLIQSQFLNFSTKKAQIYEHFYDSDLLKNVCNTFNDSTASLENLKTNFLQSLDITGWNRQVFGFIDAKKHFSNLTEVHCMLSKGNCENTNKKCAQKLCSNENKKQLTLLASFLLTMPGMPVNTYGDKLKLEDECNHLVEVYENLNATKNDDKIIKEKITKLIELRKHNLALNYGDLQVLTATKNLLILYRTYFFEFTFIIFNKDSKPQAASFRLPEKVYGMLPQALYNSPFNTINDFISIEIPAYGFEVLTR